MTILLFNHTQRRLPSVKEKYQAPKKCECCCTGVTLLFSGALSTYGRTALRAVLHVAERRATSPFALMPLGESVRQFCSGHHLALNTDLGQHFLIDEDVLRRIVETAKIEPNDRIVEIGPGIGILTAELLKKEAKVTAIELDLHLIPLLQEFITKNQKLETRNLSIVHGNALTTPFPEEPYKIVANIPYHITSPLLRHAFLESSTPPTTMTLLIQREVAEKICLPAEARSAKVGDTQHHTLLSILVALFGKPKLVQIVPPESFLPPPKVDSAVLHIDCFEEPLAETETIDAVFRLTKMAFSQKRKMLRNTLGSSPEGMTRLAKAGIDPERRPQTLTIEEWLTLAE